MRRVKLSYIIYYPSFVIIIFEIDNFINDDDDDDDDDVYMCC